MLLSWAVPKGPTLDPDVRRMAVHVEDHPLDYFDFEGVIGAGGYGAGDVIVWDWGTWTLAKGRRRDRRRRRGDLHFDLVGEKLSGRFALVRRGDDKQWLLIKKHDDAARPGWDPGDHPRSVKYGTHQRRGPRRAGGDVVERGDLGAADRRRAGRPRRASGERDVALRRPRCRAGRPRRGGRSVGVTRRDRRPPPCAPRAGDAAVPRWTPGRPAAAGEQVVIDSSAALVEVVAAGAVELHPLTTTTDDPDRPTWVVMDIEADDAEDALVVARLHRAALEHLGVDARPVAARRRRVAGLDPHRPAVLARAGRPVGGERGRGDRRLRA